MYLVYAINIYDFFINFYILKSSFHLNLTCQKYLMDMFHMVMTAWGTHTQGVVQGNYCLVLGLLPWVFGGCS